MRGELKKKTQKKAVPHLPYDHSEESFELIELLDLLLYRV